MVAPLRIGDRVMDASGTREGKLVDIDGDTGYVMQANGVEVEFPLGRLKPYEAAGATARGNAPARPDHTLPADQRALLRSVPPAISSAVAASYDGGAEPGSRQAFADLSDKAKLEAIRIHLPSLPPRLLGPHLKLVVAFRDLARTMPGRPPRR